MELQIILMYVLAACLNVAALWRVRLARLTFMDGLILGMTYYVIVAMVAALAAGRIGPEFSMNAGIFAVLIHLLLLLVIRAGRDLFGKPRRRLPPPRPPLPSAANLKGSIL